MVIGTAGHIDHGKTTLVRALTGVDTDRLPEEQRRKITIELGFAPLNLPGVGRVGVVDVPGHEAFVRTMVAGATGIDVALVVVAADEGIMPQTREHLVILGLLGIEHAVVALTRSDLVEDEWLALVRDDVRAALREYSFSEAAIVPVSAVTGAGLDELRGELATAVRRVVPRGRADLFRLPVDRVFTVRGTGTVVSGTVWSGAIERDDLLRLADTGLEVRVRGLHAFGESVERVGAGDRAAIALAGVDLAAVQRGAVLVQGDAWQPSRVLRADVTLLLDAPRPLGPRERVRLQLGTSDVAARIIAPGGALEPGDRRSARVILEQPVVARAGDRFVLRVESPAETIGGGVVLDPQAPRRARAWPLAQRSPRAALDLLLDEAGADGVLLNHLTIRLGVTQAALPQLLADADVWRVGDRGVSPGMRTTLADRLRALLSATEGSDPLADGIPMSAVRARLRAPVAVADSLLADLAANGEIVVERGMVRRAGHAPALDDVARAVADRLCSLLLETGAEPPTLTEAAAMLSLPAERVQRIAHFLARQGTLIGVEADRFYPMSVVERLVGTLRGAMLPERSYTASELRAMLGTTRKFLIPLLEYCDRMAYTLRDDKGERRLAARLVDHS